MSSAVAFVEQVLNRDGTMLRSFRFNQGEFSMKAKFLVSAALGAGKKKSGVEQVETPMLMLAKFSGMNLSADLEGLVESTDGLIQDKLAESGFKGVAGEHLTIDLAAGSKQKQVMFIGLGKAGNFNCETV